MSFCLAAILTTSYYYISKSNIYNSNNKEKSGVTGMENNKGLPK